ncbi:hypothetical protein CB1_000880041 [Camelus ferus]|nr:hypothetical protein CB1_000880041 [Camelus ferus]
MLLILYRMLLILYRTVFRIWNTGDSVTNFLEQDTDPTGKGLGVAIQLSIRTASAPVSYRGGKPITFRQNEGNVITCRPTSTGPKWTSQVALPPILLTARTDFIFKYNKFTVRNARQKVKRAKRKREEGVGKRSRAGEQAEGRRALEGSQRWAQVSSGCFLSLLSLRSKLQDKHPVDPLGHTPTPGRWCPESYCPAHHHHQHDLPQHPASLTSGAPHAGFRCPGPSQLVRAPLDLPQPEAAALP